jgi:hypothetical protein
MIEVIEIPIELTHFQLPEAVHSRLQFLLDRQDAGEADFLSLLHLRSAKITKLAKQLYLEQQARATRTDY